jgi:hypothetical protein
MRITETYKVFGGARVCLIKMPGRQIRLHELRSTTYLFCLFCDVLSPIIIKLLLGVVGLSQLGIFLLPVYEAQGSGGVTACTKRSRITTYLAVIFLVWASVFDAGFDLVGLVPVDFFGTGADLLDLVLGMDEVEGTSATSCESFSSSELSPGPGAEVSEPVEGLEVVVVSTA